MKKTKAITALLLTVLLTAVFVSPTTVIQAETERILPYYYLNGSYDKSAKKYTINVYLYSKDVLDVGTFGIKFSDGLKDKTKSYTTYVPVSVQYEETGAVWDYVERPVTPSNPGGDVTPTEAPEQGGAEVTPTVAPEISGMEVTEPVSVPINVPEFTEILPTAAPTASPTAVPTAAPTEAPASADEITVPTPSPTDEVIAAAKAVSPASDSIQAFEDSSGEEAVIVELVASDITDMFAFSWNASDMYVSDGSDIPYKIHMGKFEIENVEEDELTTESFTVLDWNTTPMKGNYYDEEIWRAGYSSEISAGIKGYYQGQKHETIDPSIDVWSWVDIGLYIDSDVELKDPQTPKLTLKGKISGYNPHFRFMVYLYQEGADITSSDPIYTFDSSDTKYVANVTSDDRGWTTWDMVLEDISPDYKYQMVIRKVAHIPYPTIVIDPSIASEDTKTLTVGEVPLICGDLDSNGVIKLRDRILLMRMLNRQTTGSGLGYDMEDLDGIGGVNLMDLTILRNNFETNYDPANLAKAKAEGSSATPEPTPGT